MGDRVHPATFLILDKWLRGDGKQIPGWATLQVLVAELVDGDVVEGSHLGRLLALAGLKAALKIDTIDPGCVVLVKALLHTDTRDTDADKDLLLRVQTEAVLHIFREADADENVDEILGEMFGDHSTDTRMQARRKELKLAWEAGVDSEAMHKVFSRYLSQDLKADLHHLALRVEAKLPPPVLHKLYEETQKGAVAKHLAAPPGPTSGPKSGPTSGPRLGPKPGPKSGLRSEPRSEPRSRSGAEVVAILISIATQEMQKKQGEGVPAPVEVRSVEGKEKEKRRLDIEILKLRVELMKNLPSSQSGADAAQSRLQALQASLHIITLELQELKQST